MRNVSPVAEAIKLGYKSAPIFTCGSLMAFIAGSSDKDFSHNCKNDTKIMFSNGC